MKALQHVTCSSVAAAAAWWNIENMCEWVWCMSLNFVKTHGHSCCWCDWWEICWRPVKAYENGVCVARRAISNLPHSTPFDSIACVWWMSAGDNASDLSGWFLVWCGGGTLLEFFCAWLRVVVFLSNKNSIGPTWLVQRCTDCNFSKVLHTSDWQYLFADHHLWVPVWVWRGLCGLWVHLCDTWLDWKPQLGNKSSCLGRICYAKNSKWLKTC